MPKDTFLNLPPDKKQSIVTAGLDEFSRHNYATAAVSRIAAKAGVAKGSLYQYFADKRDFYFYLLDFAADAKLDYITRSLDLTEADFFVLYKRMLLAGTKFDLEQAAYSRLLYNAGQEKHHAEIGNAATRLLERSQEYLKNFLAAAQTDGRIRRDIDCDLLAYLISRISVSIGDYLMRKYNFSLLSLIREGTSRLPLSETELENAIDGLIACLRNGLERHLLARQSD